MFVLFVPLALVELLALIDWTLKPDGATVTTGRRPV
jgi:hypothetical protein